MQVAQQQYKTWVAFVDDFKLMCNNAMVYNQKRSRVHKTAVTMLRAGIKQLQQMELEGCKAINCPLPLPDGPQLATALQHPSAMLDPTTPQQAADNEDKALAAQTLPPPKAVMKPPAKVPPKKVTKASPPKKIRVPQKPSAGGMPSYAPGFGLPVERMSLEQSACVKTQGFLVLYESMAGPGVLLSLIGCIANAPNQAFLSASCICSTLPHICVLSHFPI